MNKKRIIRDSANRNNNRIFLDKSIPFPVTVIKIEFWLDGSLYVANVPVILLVVKILFWLDGSIKLSSLQVVAVSGILVIRQ